MNQASARLQKRHREWLNLKYTMSLADKTGLCAVCGLSPRYIIRPGEFAMTCERPQCKRAWILFEPYRCEFCESLDFERVAMQWDEKGRKLFRCGPCNKTYAIHRRVVFETMADHERELGSAGGDLE